MRPGLLNTTVVSFFKIRHGINGKKFEPCVCRKTSLITSLVYHYNNPAYPTAVSIHFTTTATTAATIPIVAILRSITWAYSTMYVNHVFSTLGLFVATTLVVGGFGRLL